MVSAPALADQKADAHAQALDRAFRALKAAPDEAAAGQIEQRIQGLWLAEASPAATLLLARGDRDLKSDAGNAALEAFDAVLTLEPDFAEAFLHRAAARSSVGDYPGALADIQQTLRRDPRHFTALRLLSDLAEERGDWKGALAAWQKALELAPRAPGGAARLETLTRKVEGEPT